MKQKKSGAKQYYYSKPSIIERPNGNPLITNDAYPPYNSLNMKHPYPHNSLNTNTASHHNSLNTNIANPQNYHNMIKAYPQYSQPQQPLDHERLYSSYQITKPSLIKPNYIKQEPKYQPQVVPRTNQRVQTAKPQEKIYSYKPLNFSYQPHNQIPNKAIYNSVLQRKSIEMNDSIQIKTQLQPTLNYSDLNTPKKRNFYHHSLPFDYLNTEKRPQSSNPSNTSINNTKLNNKYISYDRQISEIQNQYQVIFNDDDSLVVKNDPKIHDKINKTAFDVVKDLKFQIRPLTRSMRLSKSGFQVIPAMLSVSTKSQDAEKPENIEQNFQNRPGVDLVCVIDRSGSMQGSKLSLVKKTLNYMLGLLGERDRICIIIFDDFTERLTNLASVSDKNLPFLSQQINSLECRGGTNIQYGMDMAFKVLKERKYKNTVSSIFLLSDGIDYGAQMRVQQSLMNFNLKDNFTINTFGFGADHDERLMADIAKLRDGNFYFIQLIQMVDECFVDALGGLFSVVLCDVDIRLNLHRRNPITDHAISKTYGKMWMQANQSEQLRINIEQLMRGTSKEYLFEIQMPPNSSQITDLDRNAVLATATLVCTDLTEKKTKHQKKAQMVVNIYNESQSISLQNSIYDEFVLLNLMRVQGAETLEKAMFFAEKSQYKASKSIIEEFMASILKTKPSIQKQLEYLVSDLKTALLSCQQDVYIDVGSKRMTNIASSHMNQKTYNSLGNSNNQYSSPIQSSLTYQIRSSQN